MFVLIKARSHGLTGPWLLFATRALLVAWLALSGAPVAAQTGAQPATQQTIPRDQAVAILLRDFDLSRALLAQGKTAEARVILDRLVTAAPQTPAFRLLLAEVLLRLDERDRARFHYDSLLGAPLSVTDRAHVVARLAALAAKPGWKARLTFGLVPQSNVGQRTDTDTITIGGLDFGLEEGSKAGSGTGASVSAGVSRQWLPSARTALAFGVQADGYLYADTQFNDVRLRSFVSLRHQLTRTLIAEAGVAHSLRFLGNSPYARGPGGWLGLETGIGPATVLSARAQADMLTHPDAPGLDGARRGLSLGLRHQVSPALALTAQLAFDRTDARTASDAGHGATLAVGLRTAFAGGLTVGLDLSARQDRRDAPDPLFGTVRADTTAAVAVKLMKRDFTLFNHAPMIEIRHERRNSTLPLAEFRNTSFGIYLSREF